MLPAAVWGQVTAPRPACQGSSSDENQPGLTPQEVRTTFLDCYRRHTQCCLVPGAELSASRATLFGVPNNSGSHPSPRHRGHERSDAGSGSLSWYVAGRGFKPRDGECRACSLGTGLTPSPRFTFVFSTSSFSGEQGRLWGQTPAGLGSNRVTLGRTPNPPGPQFLHLQDGMRTPA